MAFGTEHLIATREELRAIYRAPHKLVVDKERPVLDEATQSFLRMCPFVAVGTVGADGTADVSPRGGPSGFIRVLDESHLAIPDLSGNNRLDTLENIVANGAIGLLFVMPGRGETVRVNGQAHLTSDPQILDAFPPELKPPKVAVVVKVVGTYIHCAKAMQRSHIWDPETWAAYESTPDGAEILACQSILPAEMTATMIRKDLAAGYSQDLAAERA